MKFANYMKNLLNPTLTAAQDCIVNPNQKEKGEKGKKEKKGKKERKGEKEKERRK